MGIMFFSGPALSINNRTPLPVTVDNMTLLIAIGYLLSIAFMIFLPRFIVWAERISTIIALGSALALFFPFPPAYLGVFIYIQAFCCVFMIGFENAIIVYLFSEETAIWYLLVAYPLNEILIAILQNDIIKIPFIVFGGFTIIALLLLLYFSFNLPDDRWPQLLSKKDKIICPKYLYSGIFILVLLVGLLTLFANTIAQTVTHGISIHYLSTAVFSLGVFFIWKKFAIHPIKSITGLIIIAVFGFVVAFLSLYNPSLILPACIFSGAGTTALSLLPILGIMMASQYPSRFISPLIISLALISVLIQSTILQIFRSSSSSLYVVYLIIAVIIAILYLSLEPYLIYSFRKQNTLSILKKRIEKTSPDSSTTIEDTQNILNNYAFDKLSKQEIRLAELILQGYTNREMADKMGLTLGTVKVYRQNLYSKLQIHSKRELFELANSKN